MKSIHYMAGFLLLLSSVLLTHCTADRGGVSTPAEIIARSNWSIRSFHSGGDQTSQYAGYTFTFDPKGTLTISNSSEKSAGSWRWVHNAQTEMLDLQLSDHPGLEALDDQWTLEQWGLYTLTLKRGADVLTLQQQPLP
jgi:hypothetical protein